MGKLLLIIALLALVKSTILYRVSHRLPLRELKRRARAGDHQATAIYKVAANSKSLDTFIYIVGFAAAAFLLIAAARSSWWLAVIVIAFIVWLTSLAPQPKVGGPLWRFSAWSAPMLFKTISWLRPLLEPLGRLLPANLQPHSGAYELEDLIGLLKLQAEQEDNRIPKEDLKIAAGALEFGGRSVMKTMTPRRAVHFVSEDEVLGPLLLDELHKTGFSRFPVVRGSGKTNMPQVVGTLYLKDIIEVGQENKGKVKDHMKKGAYFINESCDLHQALDAILTHQHHQLVVVNNFEEMVGVITLEDVLEQIIGASIVDEFDKYDSLRAVAGLEAKAEHAAHEEIAPEPAVQEPAEPEALASRAK